MFHINCLAGAAKQPSAVESATSLGGSVDATVSTAGAAPAERLSSGLLQSAGAACSVAAAGPLAANLRH